jgi:hypothetical protein
MIPVVRDLDLNPLSTMADRNAFVVDFDSTGKNVPCRIGRVLGIDHWTGPGRKEPCHASARLPNSVQMGSYTVTRNTLQKQISMLPSRDNLDIPIEECPLDLDLMDQCLNTETNVPSSRQRLSVLHELAEGVPGGG